MASSELGITVEIKSLISSGCHFSECKSFDGKDTLRENSIGWDNIVPRRCLLVWSSWIESRWWRYSHSFIFVFNKLGYAHGVMK